MIEEIGTVVELKSKMIAVVMCKKSSLCENCATNGNCALGDDGRTRLIDAQNSLGATVGDQVRIATTTKSFLKSSFLLYIVPLIALVVGAVAGKLVGENLDTGLDPNLLSAVFGVFFMIGSFVLLRVGSSALTHESYMPKIVAILRDVE
ncbi:MAG: SoxR reducing system RseC family protein [Desulfuromonadales bacterium]|nr:SoxR reducing system RseC family protein [Desulfuromonadales bacterium]